MFRQKVIAIVTLFKICRRLITQPAFNVLFNQFCAAAMLYLQFFKKLLNVVYLDTVYQITNGFSGIPAAVYPLLPILSNQKCLNGRFGGGKNLNQIIK